MTFNHFQVIFSGIFKLSDLYKPCMSYQADVKRILNENDVPNPHQILLIYLVQSHLIQIIHKKQPLLFEYSCNKATPETINPR